MSRTAAKAAAPEAMAPLHRPRRWSVAAMCSATSDEEQAVSTATLGPWSANANDRRPTATLHGARIQAGLSV